MRLLYGDPDELDRLATFLRSQAAQVQDRADQQITRAEAAQWVSISAQAYRDQLHHRRVQAHQVADNLHAAADALAAHAQQVRDQTAAIGRIERQVTEWLANRARDVVDAVRTVRLPPPGDKSWLEVGDTLRRNGEL